MFTKYRYINRLINQYHTPKENMMKQGDMNIHSINDRWVNT